jgi:hypothetical protein
MFYWILYFHSFVILYFFLYPSQPHKTHKMYVLCTDTQKLTLNWVIAFSEFTLYPDFIKNHIFICYQILKFWNIFKLGSPSPFVRVVSDEVVGVGVVSWPGMFQFRINFWNYESCTDISVGLHGWWICSSQGLSLKRTAQRRKMHTYIYASSGIRTNDSSVRVIQNHRSFRPRGHWEEEGKGNVIPVLY